MNRKRIGALTIGQVPRPDLVAPLQQMLPQCELVQAGALDNLTAADLPVVSGAKYPLVTRLRDGTLVRADESFLSPLLQNALNRLEVEKVVATVLLCAGSFNSLHSRQPLFKPFDIACATLKSMGVKKVGVVCPVKEQEPPIKQRWTAADFIPVVWTAQIDTDNINLPKDFSPEVVVLDYVGHPTKAVLRLQAALDVPVLDLGHLTCSVLAGAMSFPESN